jgi:hypothetical protein
MEIKYKIEESDFLDFQLFKASKSERIRKKKKNGWIFLTVASCTLAIYFYMQDDLNLTIYFGLITIICGFFYPRYFRWRYKKHFKSYIKENYQKQFGEIAIMEITEEYIYLKEIDEINETKKHFLLEVSTGMSLIVPKREINNIDLLRNELTEFGLKINDELNWEWN